MTVRTSPTAIDTQRGELLDAQGHAIFLRRRSLGVLISLARGVDRVVSKEDLIGTNWPGKAVSDESLAHCISDIRSIFGTSLRTTIRTASGRGYMLSGWHLAPDGRLMAPTEPEAYGHGGPGADRPSIAVLPFTSVGGADRVSYFADGIAEDLIDALSRVRWFFVIAKGSSFTYRDGANDLRNIGRELGVRYILNGTVRRDSGHIRLTGQLVEAETGRQLWAGRHDGTLDDIFDLQDRITAGVLAAVEPNVRLAEIERARRKPTANLGAYDLYLQAQTLQFAYTQAAFAQAETLLRRAEELDGSYSDALAALADCVGRMALNGWIADRDAAFSESCTLAGRAVSADPENPTSLATAAWAYAMFAGGLTRRSILRTARWRDPLLLRLGLCLCRAMRPRHRTIRGGAAAQPGRSTRLLPASGYRHIPFLCAALRRNRAHHAPYPLRSSGAQHRAALSGRRAGTDGQHQGGRRGNARIAVAPAGLFAGRRSWQPIPAWLDDGTMAGWAAKRRLARETPTGRFSDSDVTLAIIPPKVTSAFRNRPWLGQLPRWERVAAEARTLGEGQLS